VRDVCAAHGLEAPLVQEVSFEPDQLGRALQGWVAQAVSGVCSFNDELALALMAVARRHGIGVPDDLALIGMDDAREAALAQPALTSVALDTERVGLALAHAVLAGLDGRDERPALGGVLRLVVRESS